MIKKIAAFIEKYIRALFYCLYLFSAGVFFSKNRRLIKKIGSKHTKEREPILPDIEVSEIAADGLEIQVRGTPPRSGNTTTFETSLINKLIKQYHPLTIFEIGTFDGLSTLNMAANSLREAVVYTLDLPRTKPRLTQLSVGVSDKGYIDEETAPIFLGTDCENKIRQLYGDSATFDFSPFYNRMDFVFVDGAHSYPYVMNDSKIALKLLRNGNGIILWHDYGIGLKVTDALNELYLKEDEFRNVKHIHGTTFAILMVGCKSVLSGEMKREAERLYF